MYKDVLTEVADQGAKQIKTHLDSLEIRNSSAN